MVDTSGERLARVEESNRNIALALVKLETAMEKWHDRLSQEMSGISNKLESNSKEIFENVFARQNALEEKLEKLQDNFVTRKEFAIYMGIAWAIYMLILFLADKLWK